MPRVPLVSSDRALAALRRLGCHTTRAARGSHLFLYRDTPDGRKGQVLLVGQRQIKRATLKATLDGLGISVQEFIDAL